LTHQPVGRPRRLRGVFGEVKTAMVMNNWIEETTEEKIIFERSTAGDLYRTIENAKWLLHSTREVAALVGAKNKKVKPLSNELVERVSKGIKRELLPIVSLEGVGRVRGIIIITQVTNRRRPQTRLHRRLN
jgi:helicase